MKKKGVIILICSILIILLISYIYFSDQKRVVENKKESYGCTYDNQTTLLKCNSNLQIVNNYYPEHLNDTKPLLAGNETTIYSIRSYQYQRINSEQGYNFAYPDLMNPAFFVYLYDGEKSYTLQGINSGFYEVNESQTVWPYKSDIEFCDNLIYPPILPWHNIREYGSMWNSAKGHGLSDTVENGLSCDFLFDRTSFFKESWTCEHFNESLLKAYCFAVTDEERGKEKCLEITASNQTLSAICDLKKHAN